MKFKSGPQKIYEWVVGDKTLNQATPGTGTKYEVLPETRNVRIIGIFIKVTWTVQPSPLELWVTVDDEQMRFFVVDPVSGTAYYPYLEPVNSPTNLPLGTTDFTAYKSFLLEGRKVKIEAETTAGTVSNLYCKVKYQVLKP